MIYDSPEIIPAKLYFKILEAGDLSLLSDEKDVDESILKAAWEKIEEEYSSSNKHISKDLKKVIDLSKQIEALECKLKFVELAVYHLRNLKDDELIDELKKMGYTFNWTKVEDPKSLTAAEAIFHTDLDRIERESQALTIKITRLQQAMPKPKENKGEIPSFDETVLMYSAFTGLGYINPNELPLTQYDALIVNGNKKMKSLEASSSKK